MFNNIIVEYKTVFGNELIYPINEGAIVFAELIGKKTFTKKDLSKIEYLGFKVCNKQGSSIT